MKKILLLTAFFAALSFQTQAAVKNPFYLGVGYRVTNVDYKNDTVSLGDGSSFSYDSGDYMADNFANFNLFAGYQIHERLGVEIGYFSKGGKDKSNNNTGLVWIDTDGNVTTKSDTRLTVVDLDAVFNTGFGNQDRFKILGILGAAYVDLESKTDYYDDGALRANDLITDSGIGANIGFGIELEVVKDVASVRAIAKYTKVMGVVGTDSLASYNFGLKFNF